VLKALAKDPDQRYQSADDFRLALQHAVKSPAATRGIALRFRVATLALAVCATAATGGFERIPTQTPVPAAFQPLPPAIQPAEPADAVLVGRPPNKVTAHTARTPVTAQIEEPRILVQPPIIEEPETVNETIAEPEQQQEEAPAVEAQQPQEQEQQEQQHSAPHKKGFWSKLNPFKKKKSEQPR